MMKLGSLFDGSGGFPLAGLINGIEPVWASEIEKYPVAVTTARLPQMKHLGSVLDVNGADVEPVDIITFGSPCQDLSVAGKQVGLHKGERSNLFFEAIRIIKEMREATNEVYPRIAVWENVPGAYSSNKGEDFRAVLQAFCSVKDETANVPMPPKGKWHKSGAIVGDGWSVAWRTLNAQFWGVPQRRRRIYLIADFGSERAGEILFEQESLRGDSAESGTAGEGTADNAEGSVGRGVRAYDIGEARLRNPQEYIELSPTLTQRCGTGGNNTPAVCYALQANGIDRADTAGCNGAGWRENESYTLNTVDRHAVCYSIREETKANNFSATELKAVDQAVAFHATQTPISSEAHTPCIGANSMCGVAYSKDYKDVTDLIVEANISKRRYIIRRLTPLECLRLQGFPDWWENGVQGSDSARYKMWGNGIALPNAAFVIGCAKNLIQGEHH